VSLIARAHAPAVLFLMGWQHAAARAGLFSFSSAFGVDPPPGCLGQGRHRSLRVLGQHNLIRGWRQVWRETRVDNDAQDDLPSLEDDFKSGVGGPLPLVGSRSIALKRDGTAARFRPCG
jgi:hypothetical protein